MAKPPDDPPPTPDGSEIDDLWAEIDFSQPPAQRPAGSPMTSAPAPSRTPSSLRQNAERAKTSPEPVVRRHLEELGSPEPLPDAGPPPASAGRIPLHAPTQAGDPMDLLERALPAETKSSPAHEGAPSSLAQDMLDRYAVGDFTGALVIAESILESSPDEPLATKYAASCRENLTQMYAARLGPTSQVIRVTIPPDQITWLSLDHRAGFLLSMIDGSSTVDEVLDVSGMTRLEALRILYTLVQQRVVALG
jgi:hypothetical protein